MESKKEAPFWFRKCVIVSVFFVAVTTCGLDINTALGGVEIGLFDVFETQMINTETYTNPFDFNEIELRATFSSPSGRQIDFFGFYDGNGLGGQTGSVWKLRFMPDELGTWNYTYTWTDGTPGSSGSFDVVDTGLPGPLKEATDNSWYFMTSRGQPFHARPYDLHHVGPELQSVTWENASSTYITIIQNKMIADNYNMAMVDSPSDKSTIHNWWLNKQKDIFDVSVWNDYEKILSFSLINKVYIFPFDGMVSQPNKVMLTNIFIRYFVARFAAYYNYFGWSPTWEWPDIWTTAQLNEIMQQVYDIDPWKRLLTAHDSTKGTFTGWLGFSLRQHQVRSIFDGNDRISSDSGATQPPFVNQPVIGSEDIWEMSSGQFGNPRNATEVRRGAWGEMLAGVMPLYSEWTKWTDNPGNMPGGAEVIRMFDFFYSKTRYRKYQMLNNLVSSLSRQLASGIPGQEYLVYDEDGGTITIDLSGTPSTSTFSVLWFDPKSGVSQSGGIISGGAVRSISSPFSGDSVLLLDGAPSDVTPPSVPTGVIVD